MYTGDLTRYIDVAQVVLYGFWIFFGALIIYLRMEDKREGYPLESDRTNRTKRVRVVGWPDMPAPKTFILPHGGTVQVPNDKRETREIAARPVGAPLGGPLEPTGNPMVDGVGPAAWAERSDLPDYTIDNAPKIVPLRVATDFSIESRDPDPRGMHVVGCDEAVGGVVCDVWVDRSEPQIRYLEVDVADGHRRVLLPIGYVRFDTFRNRVWVKSITGAQFAQVPGLANPDLVTLLEEDKVCSYYAGGHLYATPSRQEPLV
ncbi:MAG: photosynthetic reaction center subunit H [Betaproteobacteria bacterium]|nr:photosynthetic reaction center subunit H [Betaproteobacteria bacterium]